MVKKKVLTRFNRVAIGIIIALVILGVLGFIYTKQIIQFVMSPTESSIPSGAAEVSGDQIETLASNLQTPWALARLPNGDWLVTERSGQLRRIGDNGATYPVTGVRETSEGGLLGLALHPDFTNNQLLYVYLTTIQDGDLTNQIERYRLTNDRLAERTEIVTGIPASSNHDGGALAFGPDDKLYATTGDAGVPELAQDKQSLAGKILRMNSDGSVPGDNPFGNLVWSYGHRNPQGLAWDESGALWATEHGPSGPASGRDELNLIEKGLNYGWPAITGTEVADGMRTPVVQSGDDDTWAPAGLAYADGSLYFTGLRSESVYQAVLLGDGETVRLVRHLSGEYGRLRAVSSFEDALYVSTSNRDGRGSPADVDDRILKIKTSVFTVE